jgi:hypothetical protein
MAPELAAELIPDGHATPPLDRPAADWRAWVVGLVTISVALAAVVGLILLLTGDLHIGGGWSFQRHSGETPVECGLRYGMEARQNGKDLNFVLTHVVQACVQG